jgi:hypothetical protein
MLRYYTLPSINGECWAHISINTDTGFFATVSDWGNYSFLWTTPGMEFRKFLMGLQPDYLYGKLMMGRPDIKVFDGRKTVANLREAIEQKSKWMFYREEIARLNELGVDPTLNEVERWESETRLDSVWEHIVYAHEPQCTGFCEKVWPRFVELLKAELEKEMAFQSFKEQLTPTSIGLELEAAPGAVEAMGAAMTGPDRNG